MDCGPFKARLRMAARAVAVAAGASLAASALGGQLTAEQLRRVIAKMEERGDQEAAAHYRRMLAELPEPAAAATEASLYRRWSCTERLNTGRPLHVESKQPTALPGFGEVYIRMPDIRRNAWTTNRGLNIRWNWNDPDDDRRGYRYAFIIEPSGQGAYFDFDHGELQDDGTTSASPRQLYSCRVESDSR